MERHLRIQALVPETVHKEFKILATMKGKTMQELVNEMILKAIKNKNK